MPEVETVSAAINRHKDNTIQIIQNNMIQYKTIQNNKKVQNNTTKSKLQTINRHKIQGERTNSGGSRLDQNV